jgi:hypothetical protein
LLPRGSVPIMASLALPPREVGSHATMWLRPVTAPLAPPPQEAGFHAATRLRFVMGSLAPPPVEAGFHAATWLHACGASLGSAFPRGGLLLGATSDNPRYLGPCFHVLLVAL